MIVALHTVLFVVSGVRTGAFIWRSHDAYDFHKGATQMAYVPAAPLYGIIGFMLRNRCSAFLKAAAVREKLRLTYYICFELAFRPALAYGRKAVSLVVFSVGPLTFCKFAHRHVCG